MSKADKEFLKKLLVTFGVEAREHITSMSSQLLELEKALPDGGLEIIETIFREAHSLKGAARAVGVNEVESVCQSMETVFALLKRKEIAASRELLDVLHHAIDLLQKLVSSEGSKPDSADDVQVLIKQLGGYAAGQGPAGASTFKPDIKSTPDAVGGPMPQTVRIATSKLDSLLLQAEELVSAKMALRHRAQELREASGRFAILDKQKRGVLTEVRSVERSLGRNGAEGSTLKNEGQIKSILEFVEWNDGFAKSIQTTLARLARSLEDDQRLLGRMVDDLLQEMKGAVMMPFSTILEAFPKIVRDLARDQGKDVELVIRGATIEIDKRILEEMKDPLIHLLRNSVDHGIEKPEQRRRDKKPLRGTVTIAVAQKDGHRVEILVSDDGAGIDPAKVRSAALKVGALSAEEAEQLNEEHSLSLIFQSGVSTSPMITDISGRGLGLAIVQEKVEKLAGLISVETQTRVGTTLRIVVPMTLATFRGLLVREAEHVFAIPLTNVERVLRVKREEIKTIQNRKTIAVDDHALSLVRLGDTLELSSHVAASQSVVEQVVLLGAAEKRIAFHVDEILNEQEILVKSLGKQLSRVRNIAGATVLPTGRVVPVLNVSDLMKSAMRPSVAQSPASIRMVTGPTDAERKSVLVVEDSITARALLKNILESSGYRVKAAVDGIDALTLLKTEHFDLVVSDVDMPRMNGLDLTAKIRSDKKLSEIPLVLVTALESREDRERGVEVGANAYIVKSKFDQSNLLEVIQRLI